MPLFLHSEIRSAHRATLFCPFSCCSSVLIIKKHPRTADSIRVSHILSATIQEYSFTLFNLPQVAVSFDAYIITINSDYIIGSKVVRRDWLPCAQLLNVFVFSVKIFTGFEVLAIGTLTCEHDICLYAVSSITTS